MTSLWDLVGQRFGRDPSPIIGQWQMCYTVSETALISPNIFTLFNFSVYLKFYWPRSFQALDNTTKDLIYILGQAFDICFTSNVWLFDHILLWPNDKTLLVKHLRFASQAMFGCLATPTKHCLKSRIRFSNDFEQLQNISCLFQSIIFWHKMFCDVAKQPRVLFYRQFQNFWPSLFDRWNLRPEDFFIYSTQLFSLQKHLLRHQPANTQIALMVCRCCISWIEF